MYYLADTVALVRHLRGGRGLGRRVRTILGEADEGHHTIAISGITLMEILYLSERRRIPVDLTALDNLLTHSSNYAVVAIGFEVVNPTTLLNTIPHEGAFSCARDRHGADAVACLPRTVAPHPPGRL